MAGSRKDGRKSIVDKETEARSTREKLIKNITKTIGATKKEQKELEELAKNPNKLANKLRLKTYKQNQDWSGGSSLRAQSNKDAAARAIGQSQPVHIKNKVSGKSIKIFTKEQTEQLQEIGLNPEDRIDGGFMKGEGNLRSRAEELLTNYGKEAAEEWLEQQATKLKVRGFNKAQIASAFGVEPKTVQGWLDGFRKRGLNKQLKGMQEPKEFLADILAFYEGTHEYLGSLLPSSAKDEDFSTRLKVMDYIIELQKDKFRVLAALGVLQHLQIKQDKDSFETAKDAETLTELTTEILDLKEFMYSEVSDAED